MKAIRISNNAYDFLYKIAKEEKRSLVSTLDLFIQIFKEGQDVEMGVESLSSSSKTKIKNKKQTLDSITKKGI